MEEKNKSYIDLNKTKKKKSKIDDDYSKGIRDYAKRGIEGYGDVGREYGLRKKLGENTKIKPISSLHTLVDIASAQIDIISYYDSNRKEEVMNKLYPLLKESILNPSKKVTEMMEELTYEFEEIINDYKKKNPNEENGKLKVKLSELEKLA